MLTKNVLTYAKVAAMLLKIPDSVMREKESEHALKYQDNGSFYVPVISTRNRIIAGIENEASYAALLRAQVRCGERGAAAATLQMQPSGSGGSRRSNSTRSSSSDARQEVPMSSKAGRARSSIQRTLSLKATTWV